MTRSRSTPPSNDDVSSHFPVATAENGGGGDGTSENDASVPPPDVDACLATTCGNGVKNADTEICDDGNTKSGDGCSSTCRVEPGWLCTTPGVPCVAIKCGDKILAGTEDCDDGQYVSRQLSDATFSGCRTCLVSRD